MAEADKPVEPVVVAVEPVTAAPPVAEPAPAVTETAPAAPAAAVTPEPAAVTSTPTLLQEVVAERDAKAKPSEPAPVAESAKPAEAKAADAPKPTEAEAAKPAEPPKPVEYKYTLPETLKLDDAMKGKVHEAFDALRTGDAQKLIDLHNDALKTYAAEVDVHNRQAFADLRKQWRTEIMADPAMGGAGFQTTVKAVARMRDEIFDPVDLAPRKFDDGKPRLSAADEFLEYTGAGDHPVLWRALHRLAAMIGEPQAENLPANPRPTRVKAPRGLGSIYSEESRAKMNGQ